MNKKAIGIIAGLGLVGFAAYKFIYKRRMISSDGINFLKTLEGFKNKMYPDSRGLPTIGVGHLIKPNEQNLKTITLTDQQVRDLLDKDLDIFEKAVKDTIKVPLQKHQFDALVSFAFNVGVNAFKGSSLAKAINGRKGNDAIIQAFSQYRTPALLAKRRAKEARLYLTGNYSNLLANSEYNQYFKV